MAAQTDDKKLDGAGLGTLWGIIKQYIADNPSIPKATASVLGGIMVGTTLAIDNSGVLNLASGIVTAGTYKSVTVDTYGRVTAGSNPNTLQGYGITDAKIDNGAIILGADSITPATQTWVQQQGYTSNIGTVTQVKVGTSAYDPSSGVVSLPAYPTTLPASDVYSWAKASTKPSYSWSEISSRPTALSSFTNDSGYITGISYSMVVNALGYTPPSTDHTYNFAGTTFISGDNSNGTHNCNDAWQNGHYYYSSNGPSGLGESTGDGALYVQNYSSDWVGQIAQDYRNGHLFVRGKNGGVWQSWKRIIDSDNIGSQSVSYANSAGSVAWSNVSGRPTNVSSFTNDSGYITSSGSCNSATYAGVVYNNYAGYATFYWDGQGGQPTWLFGSNDGTTIKVWNPSNFSVNYASSAGNADTLDGYHESSFLHLSGGTLTGSLIISNSYNRFEPHSYGFLSMTTASNELLIGMESDTSIYVNYRLPQTGVAPNTWNWFTGNSNTKANFYVGHLSCTSFANSSDMRLKNVIGDCNIPINVIGNAPSFKYTWNNRQDLDIHIGTSAQYWQSYIPEVVSTEHNRNGSTFLSLNYVSLAMASVISVAKETVTLKEKVALLETRVESLEKKIREYESN